MHPLSFALNRQTRFCAFGLVFAFFSAWLCIRWLLKYISTHSFVPFAWYRIAFGVVVLATAYSGLVTWAA